MRLASLLIDDVDRCEELVQDAFAAAWRGGTARVDPDRLPAYLRSAVLNGARSEVRRRIVRRRPRPAIEGIPRAEPGAGEPTGPRPGAPRGSAGPGATAASAEEGALAGEQTRLVVDALRSLPARQREVLALRYYLDLTEADIADTLRISPGSVKTHAHRGLAALAERLEAP